MGIAVSRLLLRPCADRVPNVKKALTGGIVSELGVFAFCAAMGFVVAGTVASFYKLVTSEPADFSIARRGLLTPTNRSS